VECVSGAVACLVPGAVGASIPVNGGFLVAVTRARARAQRFAEIPQAEPQRGSAYVAAPDVAPSGRNPLVSFMSQLQAIDVPIGSHASAGSHEKGRTDFDSDPLQDLKIVQQEAQKFGLEMVPVSMAMAVMSTAKQGVTTLFQQQG
jgi:hypothetical protein